MIVHDIFYSQTIRYEALFKEMALKSKICLLNDQVMMKNFFFNYDLLTIFFNGTCVYLYVYANACMLYAHFHSFGKLMY